MAASSPTVAFHTRRLRLHFSLRTLLLAVSGLCVVLAVCIVPAERQRRAMNVVVEEGCKPGTLMMAFYDNKTVKGPVLSEAYFANVTGIYLYDNVCGTEQLTDDRLARIGAQLPALPKLRSLYINCRNVTDAGVAKLPRLDRIERLDLDRTQVTDDGLVALRSFENLRHLTLNGTQVSDAGLVHLHALRNLAEIDLSGTSVTDAGCRELLHALPNCRIER